jgi:hypothetical protein
MDLVCECLEGYSGQTCSETLAKQLINNDYSAGWILAPVIFILLSITAAAFYIVLRKKNYFGKQVLIGNNSVVSFRQGSNVEFNENLGGVTTTTPQQQKPTSSDFSNPMYDHVGPSSSSNSSSPAIINTTPVVLQQSPQIQIRQFDVNEDTSGKDTQNLINEAGSSEC